MNHEQDKWQGNKGGSEGREVWMRSNSSGTESPGDSWEDRRKQPIIFQSSVKRLLSGTVLVSVLQRN